MISAIASSFEHCFSKFFLFLLVHFTIIDAILLDITIFDVNVQKFWSKTICVTYKSLLFLNFLRTYKKLCTLNSWHSGMHLKSNEPAFTNETSHISNPLLYLLIYLHLCVIEEISHELGNCPINLLCLVLILN